ncbi:hypothetical protein HYH03_011404 [Edaphochlamys debaryana]|uniref:Uncharacterized protein n=1 Tax=Edaphochlamys debaryana TaxID=47281 RepID=A0A835XTR7_9CHLO|nr:hypothetical protein HYH03_011404 [Edaphochlamys debaryana]|eukprot:KAG2490098.1 hypothetical protein HYH03_011404 [Edaphochlamys debaryana]
MVVRSSATPGPATTDSEPVHVTIVGGGAAGLTAAFFAAEHGAKVTVLERTRECGKKILMSGGSRCNVLPFEVDLTTDFFSDSPASAVRAVFASWSLELCKAWLEDPWWGVGLDLSLEEESLKYFPTSNSSREVRDKLVAACLSRGVSFRYGASVEGLQPLTLTPPQPPPSGSPALEGNGTAEAPAPASASASEAAGSSGGSGGDGSDGEAASRTASGAGASSSGPAVEGVDGAAGSGAGGAARGKKKGKGGRGAKGGAAAEAAADQPPPPRTRWLCRLQDGTEHVTDKLIIATGGLSFPAVGTDGTGHRLLAALGHSLQPTYAALTPLTGAHPAGQQLAGVSMYDIELSVQLPDAKKPRTSRRTALLFTHKGYSGPAVLDLSHHAVKALTRGGRPPPPPSPPPSPAPATAAPAAAKATAAAAGGGGGSAKAPVVAAAASGPQSAAAAAAATAAAGGRYLPSGLPSLRVNWTHEPAAVWDERIRGGGTAQVATLLQRHGLRERLAEALAAECGLTGRRVCDVNRAERAALVTALTAYELPYAGHEGYKKAEVTGGGVRLEEVDCATLESRLLPGLFLCGECLDVFGRIGGFNFYWAWVTGRLAGVGAAQGGLHPKRASRQAKAAGALVSPEGCSGSLYTEAQPAAKGAPAAAARQHAAPVATEAGAGAEALAGKAHAGSAHAASVVPRPAGAGQVKRHSTADPAAAPAAQSQRPPSPGTSDGPGEPPRTGAPPLDPASQRLARIRQRAAELLARRLRDGLCSQPARIGGEAETAADPSAGSGHEAPQGAQGAGPREAAPAGTAAPQLSHPPSEAAMGPEEPLPATAAAAAALELTGMAASAAEAAAGSAAPNVTVPKAAAARSEALPLGPSSAACSATAPEPSPLAASAALAAALPQHSAPKLHVLIAAAFPESDPSALGQSAPPARCENESAKPLKAFVLGLPFLEFVTRPGSSGDDPVRLLPDELRSMAAAAARAAAGAAAGAAVQGAAGAPVAAGAEAEVVAGRSHARPEHEAPTGVGQVERHSTADPAAATAAQPLQPPCLAASSGPGEPPPTGPPLLDPACQRLARIRQRAAELLARRPRDSLWSQPARIAGQAETAADPSAESGHEAPQAAQEAGPQEAAAAGTAAPQLPHPPSTAASGPSEPLSAADTAAGASELTRPVASAAGAAAGASGPAASTAEAAAGSAAPSLPAAAAPAGSETLPLAPSSAARSATPSGAALQDSAPRLCALIAAAFPAAIVDVSSLARLSRAISLCLAGRPRATLGPYMSARVSHIGGQLRKAKAQGMLGADVELPKPLKPFLRSLRFVRLMPTPGSSGDDEVVRLLPDRLRRVAAAAARAVAAVGPAGGAAVQVASGGPDPANAHAHAHVALVRAPRAANSNLHELIAAAFPGAPRHHFARLCRAVATLLTSKRGYVEELTPVVAHLNRMPGEQWGDALRAFSQPRSLLAAAGGCFVVNRRRGDPSGALFVRLDVSALARKAWKRRGAASECLHGCGRRFGPCGRSICHRQCQPSHFDATGAGRSRATAAVACWPPPVTGPRAASASAAEAPRTATAVEGPLAAADRAPSTRMGPAPAAAAQESTCATLLAESVAAVLEALRDLCYLSELTPPMSAWEVGGPQEGLPGLPLPEHQLPAGARHDSAAAVQGRQEAAASASAEEQCGGTTLLQWHGLREHLAEALAAECGLTGRRVCDVNRAERAALVTARTAYELPYAGQEGYKKAEVTGGGVRLEEVVCATLESRLLPPGLFLCGECLDVFGRIGGFNFYWAWVTGRLAGGGRGPGAAAPQAGVQAGQGGGVGLTTEES